MRIFAGIWRRGCPPRWSPACSCGSTRCRGPGAASSIDARCRNRQPALSERRRPIAPAETPLQHTLVAIWQELLQTPQIGIDDDFFAIGGHSLLGMQMIARVRDRLGVSVAIRQLFETPTIRQFAAAVAAGTGEPATSSPSKVDREAFRRSTRPTH